MAQERSAEIRDLHFGPSGYQDIGRFDIPMYHTFSIRIVERTATLERDLDHVGDRQQSIGRRVTREIAAMHVFHRDIADLLVDDGVEDRANVRMDQLASERGFAQELA